MLKYRVNGSELFRCIVPLSEMTYFEN